MEQGQLFERDFELAALRAACVDAGSGRGAVLAVRGAAGIGKSALMDATRRAGSEAGPEVLAASGTELERVLAFGVV